MKSLLGKVFYVLVLLLFVEKVAVGSEAGGARLLTIIITLSLSPALLLLR